MPVMSSIRPARAADGARLLDIWRKAVDATHDFLAPADRSAIDAEVAAFLPQAPAWLATDPDDRAIGFMLIDGTHMDALFIDPDWHGQGVGRRLVEHALSLHPTLTTDVNEQNRRAMAFYEAMNFARTGRSDRDGQGRPYPLIHLRYAP
ncbi:MULTISPECIES: acetyltransferase [Sphingobium]|uniref:Acetyltransferase n=1 Tax=Sphingobium chungbukense TaxID=56193 RepID=A0A0M3AR80_9SPHN|nr:MULTISPECIES: acetyltransferase [Sphingobium]KKW91044.1 acetyltransferase [Sphingobium chungbukense]PJG49042.1 acetyltransferase [Sphingobium sp. LB126]